MTRIITGDRPTGALHLGHYFGTLANRVALQAAGHELMIVVADYQVLSDRDHPGDLRQSVHGLVADYLACGIDATRATIFVHSAVPELNQLLLPFLSLVSMGELSRNPTVKEEIELAGRPSVSGLMQTYPVHQAADILFCKGGLVPVGRDQLPHLELTRSIARRFNERYAPIFPLPEPLLGDAPVLLGLDGRKMAKSRGNAIALSDPTEVVSAKLKAARTDSERRITYEPERRPEVATLLTIGGLCSNRAPGEIADEIGAGGARALKLVVTEAVEAFLRPIRGRRAQVSPAATTQVLAGGQAVARTMAQRTLEEVRCAMGMAY